jgi:hypothetical protein
MNLRKVKHAVAELSLEQLVRLDAWIHSLIETGATAGPRSKVGKTHASHKTYRLEEVRCGKKNCHCAEGKLHGPYWYAYWTEGGRTRSQYVGKKLPRGVKRANSPRVR